MRWINKELNDEIFILIYLFIIFLSVLLEIHIYSPAVPWITFFTIVVFPIPVGIVLMLISERIK